MLAIVCICELDVIESVHINNGQTRLAKIYDIVSNINCIVIVTLNVPTISCNLEYIFKNKIVYIILYTIRKLITVVMIMYIDRSCTILTLRILNVYITTVTVNTSSFIYCPS